MEGAGESAPAGSASFLASNHCITYYFLATLFLKDNFEDNNSPKCQTWQLETSAFIFLLRRASAPSPQPPASLTDVRKLVQSVPSRRLFHGSSSSRSWCCPVLRCLVSSHRWGEALSRLLCPQSFCFMALASDRPRVKLVQNTSSPLRNKILLQMSPGLDQRRWGSMRFAVAARHNH